MEAVQRKMNIYGRYLPLIATFATELADRKKPPNYRKLIGEGEAAVAATAQEGDPSEEEEAPAENAQGTAGENVSEIEQKKIDEYRGS
jgi:hypothetical protein